MPKVSWHYIFRLGAILVEFLQSRRYRDPRSADRLRSMRRKVAAKEKASVLEIGFDLLQGIQPANDLFPFPWQIGLFHAAFQFLLQQ